MTAPLSSLTAICPKRSSSPYEAASGPIAQQASIVRPLVLIPYGPKTWFNRRLSAWPKSSSWQSSSAWCSPTHASSPRLVSSETDSWNLGPSLCKGRCAKRYPYPCSCLPSSSEPSTGGSHRKVSETLSDWPLSVRCGDETRVDAAINVDTRQEGVIMDEPDDEGVPGCRTVKLLQLSIEEMDLDRKGGVCIPQSAEGERATGKIGEDFSMTWYGEEGSSDDPSNNSRSLTPQSYVLTARPLGAGASVLVGRKTLVATPALFTTRQGLKRLLELHPRLVFDPVNPPSVSSLTTPTSGDERPSTPVVEAVSSLRVSV